jgi:surface carbohydrate biosynthesis protein (TIGR04326 family)
MVLTIIDSSKLNISHQGIVVCWDGYDEHDEVVSLLRFIENNGISFRNKYLDWIHDLSNLKINDKLIVDFFNLGTDGFSYWWVLNITEKSMWKSNYITDIIRLMALETIIVKNGIDEINIDVLNFGNFDILKNYCDSNGIKCNNKSIKFRKYNFNLHKFDLFFVIKAIGTFCKLLSIKLLLRSNKQIPGAKNSLFIFNYFFNIDKSSFDSGKFNSNYFDNLSSIFFRHKINVNWIHLYVKHNLVNNIFSAKKLINYFNIHDDSNHTLFGSDNSFKDYLLLIKLYVGLVIKYFQIRIRRKNVFSSIEGMNYWPLFKSEFKNSMIGSTAIGNLNYIISFKKMFSVLPYQKLGIYVSEGQGWEQVLIFYWKKFNHGNLIAYAHSNIRFWDLRYCSDLRLTHYELANARQFPDYIAINGPKSIENYLNVNFPINCILKCEALRYNELNESIKRATDTFDCNNNNILILGDYSMELTEKLLGIVKRSLINFPNIGNIIFKPHPINGVPQSGSYYKVSHDSIKNLINQCSFVITSGVSAAAVEAYIFNRKLFVFQDPGQLNLSPLRGVNTVFFFSSEKSLVDNFLINKFKFKNNVDYYFTSLDLNLWNKIIVEFLK